MFFKLTGVSSVVVLSLLFLQDRLNQGKTGQASSVYDIAWHSYGHAFDATFSDLGRPECPSRWTDAVEFEIKLPKLQQGSASPTQATSVIFGGGGIGGVEENTDVPEFHDCQRFILPGTDKYGGLYAVFASRELDDIISGLSNSNITWSASPAGAVSVDRGVVTQTGAGHVTVTAKGGSGFTGQVEVEVSDLVRPASDPVHLVRTITASNLKIYRGESLDLNGVLGPPTTAARPVGVIFAYDSGYGALGITQGLNCVYLVFGPNNALQAKVLSVPAVAATYKVSAATACKQEVSADVIGAPNLKVVRSMLVGGDARWFPAAARWDVDAVSGQYYFGFKCGAGWCEVGADEVHVTAKFTPSRGLARTVSSNDAEWRVTAIKGWYDRQELSMETGTGSGVQTVASKVIGYVVPAPNLRSWRQEHYTKQWRLTGYVAFDASKAGAVAKNYYKKKLGFTPSDPTAKLDQWNKLSICIGKKGECVPVVPGQRDVCEAAAANLANVTGGTRGARLSAFASQAAFAYSRIEAADGTVTYRCNLRREHPELAPPRGTGVPATARWRWKNSDETVWEFCDLVGCCETIGF